MIDKKLDELLVCETQLHKSDRLQRGNLVQLVPKGLWDRRFLQCCKIIVTDGQVFESLHIF
jgi:hypothetical protein